jgi:C-terminal processing protease CtpA/Prc
MEVLARALNDIESRALTQPSVERLVQAAIRGMLGELDSNSRYISVEELKAWEHPSTGGEVGLALEEVDSLCVVRLSRFSPGVAAELSKQLSKALLKKPQALLLDLRGNLGGLLQEAFGVASLFLPPQTPMVHIQGPGQGPKLSQPEKAVSSASAPIQIPLLVLMDRRSASVTEVLVAALKDNGRARVWGERSHGKGSIQEELLLPDGSALYLTVAHFVRLTGAPIDGHGVEPDCHLSQPKGCKGLEGFSPRPAKSPSAKPRDLWLEMAVFWLVSQNKT